MAKRSAEQVSKTMRSIRSKNTKIEIMLGRALWSRGYRYRKSNKKVFGTPDFTFKKKKIAIFCDSEFWHGKDWENLNKRLNTNRDFWVNKIEKNIARDKKVNSVLKEDGWVVVRFWEKEILKNLNQCIYIVEALLTVHNLKHLED